MVGLIRLQDSDAISDFDDDEYQLNEDEPEDPEKYEEYEE